MGHRSGRPRRLAPLCERAIERFVKEGVLFANYWDYDSDYTGPLRHLSDTRATDVAAVKAAIAPPVVAPAPAAVPAPVKAAPPSRPATPDRMTIMASGPSELLLVRISADYWQGRPKSIVKFDGVRLGGTLVATDGVIGVTLWVR